MDDYLAMFLLPQIIFVGLEVFSVGLKKRLRIIWFCAIIHKRNA